MTVWLILKHSIIGKVLNFKHYFYIQYIIDIECGAKETFLINLDLDLFKW